MEKEDSFVAVENLLKISAKIDINQLIASPDDQILKQGFWEAKSIITSFDFSEGQKFDQIIKEFIEVARAKKRPDHIKNLANDLRNKIFQAIEDIRHYFKHTHIQPKKDEGTNAIQGRVSDVSQKQKQKATDGQNCLLQPEAPVTVRRIAWWRKVLDNFYTYLKIKKIP